MLRISTMCILEANPPTGFTLTFSNSIIMINPSNISIITKKTSETHLPLYILVTTPKIISTIAELADEHYVASPPPKRIEEIPPTVYVYPIEKPIHIPRRIKAYFLDPPPRESQDYFILLETPFAEILIAPRTTNISNPPH